MKRTRVVLVAGVIVIVAAVVALSVLARPTPYLRDRVVSALNQRFQSQVEMESLQVAAFPRPEVSGTGLRLRHNGRTDVPPMIAIRSFSGSAGVYGLFASPLHLGTVSLDGLEINVPPGGLEINDDDNDGPKKKRLSLVIDRIESRAARLEMIPRDPSKLPRVFDIHDLVMTGFRPDTGADFTAALTNPVPRGRIETNGVFGPWRADDPGQTPVEGKYTFEKANLDTIKGIGGTLTSTGAYDGLLERIEVRGETHSPDFQIDLAHQPVPLNTKFNAVVDGTNGNTWLQEVVATLGNTTIHAEGSVIRAKDIKGRHVTVNVRIDEGRLEDLLRLAVSASKAPLTGQISVQSKLVIPAGDEDVIDKLELDGRFHLSSARFTSVDVQQRISELSRRGRGIDNGMDGESVVSNLAGTFSLHDGTMHFSELTFGVPGALVQLAGSYGLRSETLDFRGNLLLDASLRETTTGFKSVLAMMAQPFFRRPGGGTKLPIKVAGTRKQPAFSLDVRRAILPGE